jgi:hypothetical protein
MLTRLARFVIAALALACGLATTAQAQQPVTLTLACKGTISNPLAEPQTETTSMGIIVNFTTGIVQGLHPDWPGFIDYPVKITASNDVTITFSGSQQNGSVLSYTHGSIDRVTGDVEVDVASVFRNKEETKTTYTLQCRPTQRMF